MYGHTMSSLSWKALASVSKGRGGSISSLSGSVSSGGGVKWPYLKSFQHNHDNNSRDDIENEGIIIVHPLLGVTREECAMFRRCSKVQFTLNSHIETLQELSSENHLDGGDIDTIKGEKGGNMAVAELEDLITPQTTANSSISKQSLIARTSKEEMKKVSKMGIEELTKAFVEGLQRDFPMTCPTIARTISKLDTSTSSTSNSTSNDEEMYCVLCAEVIVNVSFERFSKSLVMQLPTSPTPNPISTIPSSPANSQNTNSHDEEDGVKHSMEGMLCYGCYEGVKCDLKPDARFVLPSYSAGLFQHNLHQHQRRRKHHQLNAAEETSR